MRWPRPSLVRRLVLAFILGPMAAILILLGGLRPILLNFADANAGPEIVITLVAADLERLPNGSLAVRNDAYIRSIASRSRRLWFIVKDGKQELAFGAVPPGVAASARALPADVKEAHLGDVKSSSRVEDWSMAQMDTAAGRVAIYGGGVNPDAIRLTDWFVYAHYDAEFYIGLLMIALICAAGGPLAIPVVIAGLRPTARAATKLNPADLTGRLPERGVVKELRPIVRAFNSALDRLADAFDRRKRFIADVAHELRTPLAILNMHVDALPEDRTKRDLQRTVYRLGQMVGQMLDAERLVLAARQREPLDLVALARGAVAEIAPLAITSGYELAFSSEQERIFAEGDRHALGRALANLLGNAVAHGGGSGTIAVRVGAEGWIEVSDEGPGLPEGASERIFEPFHRERWDKDGCGLGLHLVREIMRAHEGEARLVGAGSGAVFRLELPSAAALQPA
jgi:signal transduction histidine kinase